MQFVIGIDSGGTHFRIRAATLQHTVLADHDGPPLGYFTQNKRSFEEGFRIHLSLCLQQFNGSIDDCVCCVCGVSGIDSEEDRVLLHQLLENILGNQIRIICLNDAELAFTSIVHDSGILLNSGTGSIAIGKAKEGRVERVGGWPLAVCGDEGSGAWISLRAVRLLGKWFDGIVAEGPLVDLVRNNLHIHTRKEYMDFCLNHTIADLAGVASLVSQVARKDPTAMAIITDAAGESFLLVSHLSAKLGYTERDAFKVVFWGSNIIKGDIHRKILSAKLLSTYPNVEFCFSKGELTIATVDLAIEECIV